MKLYMVYATYQQCSTTGHSYQHNKTFVVYAADAGLANGRVRRQLQDMIVDGTITCIDTSAYAGDDGEDIIEVFA